MNSGPDMVMMDGTQIWFGDPSLTRINLASLRAPLARINRYIGQVEWSVLQHLVLCVGLVGIHYPDASPKLIEAVQACAALHDLHETVMTDLPSGLKPYCPDYQTLEEMWENHFAVEFGLDHLYRVPEIAKIVKFVDQRALVCETRYFDHPAYEIVREKHGNSTLKEGLLIAAVAVMSHDQLWSVLCNALNLKGVR